MSDLLRLNVAPRHSDGICWKSAPWLTRLIINYVPFILSFLKDRFGLGRVVLSRLCASDVVKFVQRQAPRLRMKRAKLMTTALRSFLNYGRYLGEVLLDLAAAVPIVANWSMTSIPRAISPEHVRQLLASIDQRTSVGRRDYAILLLLARLGLRLGEVAFLELDTSALALAWAQQPVGVQPAHWARRLCFVPRICASS